VCGIVAILRPPGARALPDPAAILDALSAALAALDDADLLAGLATASGELAQADTALCGAAGVKLLMSDRALATRAEALADAIAQRLADIEDRLDGGALEAGDLETLNAALINAKDQAWAVRNDRLPTAHAVAGLAGGGALGWSATEVYTSIQEALAAIDRLEVRGRDSAGITVLVRDHDLDLHDRAIASLLAPRIADALFRSRAARTPEGHLVLVYKAAAEIGELGDNTRELREAIANDELLRLALAGERASGLVLAHTRWASVGIISEPNAHPLDSGELVRDDGPFVAAVLNGDVDNFADLKSGAGLELAVEITTDAKVIPTLVSRHLADGEGLLEAFRATVASFEGSVAIAAAAASSPSQLLLALRGSGQALYVGLASDAFVVASEPYGVVELTDTYLRLDGETPANDENPTASRGQIVLLDAARAGELEGITRIAYDGTPLPLDPTELQHAQITTRDIDRGEFPHFLLKEITESPSSFRKTLRGKLIERDGRLTVALGPETLTPAVRAALRDRTITRVTVIGQGTAAIAGRALASVLDAAGTHLRVDAMPSTELSGFGLREAMADTLVIAISQSGTTTDTNRTVDLVRGRGAHVIGVVNRRQSDLTDKADGVLYTSDGRDIEMSVASTKAFYAQIAAGSLLAVAIAEAAGGEVDEPLLGALRGLPDAMAQTIERRADIAAAAHSLAPSRRYWAIVGNGMNRIAAEEVRIKLSELCYKSISCDATEDKKHIDLSCEPLILVCAAGLTGSTADDVAKEVAIYRAHKATPIVIATDGEARFSAAMHAISVPPTHPQLAFVLSAMAGHLFGYEAALAIDAQARPLREARAAIEAAVRDGGSGEHLLQVLRVPFEAVARQFFDGLRSSAYDGHLEASTAVRLSVLLRYALGVVSLETYQLDEGKVGTPAVLLDDLTAALTRAIEELTRPIDAIKHQAKTVTVGISRTDETLLQVPLVHELLAVGAPRDQLSYKTLRTLAELDPAIAEVTGYTRYRIEGPVDSDAATVTVIDKGGIAADLTSRAERNPALRGTKHRAAQDRDVLVAIGRGDRRPVVIVPEVKDNQATGITLLHVRFAERLPVASARGVLQGYGKRYAMLRDAVTETEPTFREDLFADIDVADLLCQPIGSLADRWRTS
jgi:glucosamine--fructose-6-phosphate aminotransferase (isomerizing)